MLLADFLVSDRFMSKTLLTLFLPSFFLFGCTAALRQDLDTLERSMKDLRSQQAEQTSQLASLQADVRSLEGKFEELDYSQKQKIGSEVSTLKDQLSNLKRRVPPPAIVPADVLDSDEAFARTLPEDASLRFSEGLTAIREGNFEQAISVLQTALDVSGNEPQSGNILFWLGVAYEGAGDNRNAIVAYNQIVSSFPKHSRVSLALLRQAGVLNRIGDSKTASIILKKIVADHPSSAEASQSRQRLSVRD